MYKEIWSVFAERFAAWIERNVCSTFLISCSESGGKPFGSVEKGETFL
jgi:hypothetical protein